MQWSHYSFILTVEDVIAGGPCGVVVLSEHPRQGPDDNGVNGKDVPQVFVQERILQDEPAEIPSVLCYSENSQPLWGDFLPFFCAHQTSKTAVRREKERVTASSGDICASLTSTMLRLTREATVVQVAYMAMPFWTCRIDADAVISQERRHDIINKEKCPRWPAHGGATGRLCGICWATLRKCGDCGRSRKSSHSWSKQQRWGRPELQPSTWRGKTMIRWHKVTFSVAVCYKWCLWGAPPVP